MKKSFKKLGTLLLAFAMMISLVQPIRVEAATKTTKQTMYIGEAFSVTNYYEVKSVSSSKKSVATVKKDKSANYKANITAKKAGKTTVTVKTKRGTYKYVITVKKLDIAVTAQKLDNGYVLFTIDNKTAQCFDSLELSYSLKNAGGEEVKAGTTTALYSVAKSVTYETLYVGSSIDYDISQSTVKVSDVSRSPNYTYKKAGSSDYTLTEGTPSDSGYGTITIPVTIKNKTSKRMSGYIYAISYDANDNILAVNLTSIYLSSKSTDTKNAYVYTSTSTYPTYDHYKLVTRLYTKK